MDSPERNQVELLQRIACHDPQALGELYDLQSPSLYTLILRIIVDESKTGSILQEAFVRVWDEPGSYNPDLFSLSVWLIGLTRRLAIRHLRANDAGQPLLAGLSTENSGIANCALQLTPVQRTLIEHAYFNGNTQSELAEVFDLPLVTVQSEICAGILALMDSAFSAEQQTRMMSRYLDELGMINAVGALDGDDLVEFKRLSPNVTLEAQKQIASYEQVAALIAFSGAKQKMPPAPIREQVMKRIYDSLSDRPPSQ